MSKVSQEDREYIRSELTHLAEYIRNKYGLTIPGIRQFLKEMLTVSV